MQMDCYYNNSSPLGFILSQIGWFLIQSRRDEIIIENNVSSKLGNSRGVAFSCFFPIIKNKVGILVGESINCFRNDEMIFLLGYLKRKIMLKIIENACFS
jgi:hypothetical protein